MSVASKLGATAIADPIVDCRDGVARGDVAQSLGQRLAAKVLAMAPTLASSFFLFAIFVVQGALLGRTLKPEGRGEYATVITYTRFLTYIGLLGVNYAIIRRAATTQGGLIDLSRTAIRAGLISGFLTLLVVAILSFVALPQGKEHLALLSILCATTLPWEHVRLNLNAVDQGSGYFARFNAGRLVAGAAMPMLLLIFWLTGGLSVAAATYLLIPATLIGLAFRLLWSEDRRPWRKGRPGTLTLLREGMPFAPSQAGSDLFNKLDSMLILWLATSATQGLYVAAVPAVQILAVAPEALAVFAFNAGAKSQGRGRLRHCLMLAGGLLAFQVLSALIYSLVVGRLILLVYGNDFYGAVALALALLPGLVFQGCTIVADGYLRGRGKAAAGIHARLFGAAVMCTAAFMLYRIRPELAVPIAASLGNCVSALWIGGAVFIDAKKNSRGGGVELAEAPAR